MARFGVAVAASAALGPVLLVFPPLYFPWTLLVVVVASFLVGVVGRTSTARAQLAVTLGAAVTLFVVSLLALGRMGMGSIYPPLFAHYWWLFVPMLGGAVFGSIARRTLGQWGALGVGIVGVAGLAAAGAALAIALAPAEVGDAPQCISGRECVRYRCQMTAERIRLLAIERVTRYEASPLRITCVYTAWGGIHVGTAAATDRASSWDDGWWPRLLRTW